MKVEENGGEQMKKDAPPEEGKTENVFDSIMKINENIANINQKYTPAKTYINCDLRYFNFDFLVSQIGNFDSNLLALLLHPMHFV